MFRGKEGCGEPAGRGCSAASGYCILVTTGVRSGRGRRRCCRRLGGDGAGRGVVGVCGIWGSGDAGGVSIFMLCNGLRK